MLNFFLIYCLKLYHKIVKNTILFLEYNREGFVLDFCSTFWILSYVTFRKNLRSPFTKQRTVLFCSLRSNPCLYSHEKARKHPQMRMLLAFWRRERDSNPRARERKLISSQVSKNELNGI